MPCPTSRDACQVEKKQLERDFQISKHHLIGQREN